MSLTTRVLVALVLGLATGLLLAATGSPLLPPVVAVLEPAGALFINAIRMTVLPLVVASLIVGVAAAGDVGAIGRVGGRALVLFVVILLLGATFAVVVGQPLFARLELDPAAVAGFRDAAQAASGAAAENVKRIPTVAQWIVDLVPANPIKAAADGAMLPLIVFALAFGIALTRVDRQHAATVVGFFRAVADAMLVLVRWTLVLAPYGVFALAVPIAARFGVSAAGALAYYIAAASGITAAFAILVLYPAAILLGRVSPATFARACAPAQAVAFSSRSSLASLPAMIEGARTRLGLAPEITGFFLPLAAATFRAGGAVQQTLGVLFIARLYGVELRAPELLTIVVTVMLTTFSIPGVPAGSILVLVPVLLAVGLPAEGMGLLIGIDTIPDMFRTTANVTGDMAVATVLGRGSPAATSGAAPAASGADPAPPPTLPNAGPPAAT